MGNRSKEHVKVQREGKERDQHTCQICGSKNHTEGHHIMDVSFGGAANIDNIVTLCRDCHKNVHRGIIDIFRF